MPIVEKQFTIGLLATALLEDRFNKTAHMREEARRVTGRYAEQLGRFGAVSNPGFFEDEAGAVAAARRLRAEAVDCVVVIELAYQKGLIPMRALRELDVPVIVWNTQLVEEFGENADFDLIMVNSGMAGLPELTSALARSGRRFHVVTGPIGDSRALQRLEVHLRAARAVARLRNARIGIIGHPYEGMTDLMQDDYAVLETFGASSWPIVHDEVVEACAGVTEAAARGLVEEQLALGRKIEVEGATMLRSARLALALEAVVASGGYDAVAEFDQVWLSDERIGIIPFFGTSRMLERHVPFTCEADVLRAAAMLVLEEIAGHSTFLEHYILDYRRDLMFDSHDGHGNPGLADPAQAVRIVPTIYYRGVHGFGASFNYSYRPGTVTLCSIGSIGGGRFRFISSPGSFVEMQPRDIAAPQTLFRWAGGSIRDFSERWLSSAPSHHHAAAYGEHGGAIEIAAEMLGVEYLAV